MRTARIEEVIASKVDLWGEEALKRQEGPTYDYFAGLLPPLRYVDSPGFRCYPIVLSAPGGAAKGRLVSDGGMINALARQPIWVNEEGVPVRIVVGDRREQFGEDLGRLEGPGYAEGYLPIVHLKYTSGGGVYGEEVFASVDDSLAKDGAIFLRFTFPAKDRGRVELQIEGGYEKLKFDGGLVRDKEGRVVAAFDDNWDGVPFRNQIMSKVRHEDSAVAVIYTRPTKEGIRISEDVYRQQREKAAARWRAIVDGGMQVDVPEEYVNRAWRSLICGTFGIMTGQMNYSAGNQYARQYSHESGEAIRSMVEWGHGAAMRKTFKPLFEYHRPGIELHDAGFLLRDLADYYLLTRDSSAVRELAPLWRAEVARIVNGRKQGDGGLLPREHYCSDIVTPVVSISTNANCWRGLRDMAVLLHDMGETEEGAKLQAEADDYRKVILAAIEKAWDRSIDPPFLPLALGEEKAPIPITGTRIGSYWNLVINSMLGSGALRADSKEIGDVMRYMRENGGLCMGMTRVQAARVGWSNVQNIDDLYGGRYALALLERDEADRALVSFYAKLAQGLTRDTFIDGESTSIEPFDDRGRMIALPPNSAANASFLLQLRTLLVQDWDLNDDGSADTLRLLFATPRAWMTDGKQIRVERAPTEFGEVSVRTTSELKKGIITAEVKMPERTPAKALIRFRVPRGWEVVGASTDGKELPAAGAETFELTGLGGNVVVTTRVKKTA